MSRSLKKRDRTARLLRLQVLLSQYPSGLYIEDIARRCEISKRSVYRDLEALESELNVPIWEEAGKRGIAEGYFLPPITFTQAEAVSLFLAARMMQYFSPQYNTGIASTFMKLNTIVPPFLKNHIQNTIEHFESIPRDERKISNFDKLIQAWLSRHPVTFMYQALYGKKPEERTIEPYFIEPAARNRSNYVIGYCGLNKQISTFKIDRIIGDVKVEQQTYEIPADFNIDIYLRSAWGTYAANKPDTIKLLFSNRISRAVSATMFHPSQITEMQPDGSLVMTLKVYNTGDFKAWVLGWGQDVEVLEPKLLRHQVASDIQILHDTYTINNKSGKEAGVHSDNSVGNGVTITDKQWQAITALLPPQPQTGRPRANDRQTINGILQVLKSGARWSDIPRQYGAASTCYMRWKTWREQGVWARISKILDLGE
jgi:predicted DNA-binding transcriptional regulator YafY